MATSQQTPMSDADAAVDAKLDDFDARWAKWRTALRAALTARAPKGGALALRAFKHYPSLSDETEAFSAKVYLDGVYVGAAENTGKGGATTFHATTDIARSRIAALVQLLPFDMDGDRHTDIEDAIDLLVEDAINAKAAARLVKQEQRFAAKACARGFYAFKVGNADASVLYEVRDVATANAKGLQLAAKHQLVGAVVTEVLP